MLAAHIEAARAEALRKHPTRRSAPEPHNSFAGQVAPDRKKVIDDYQSGPRR